MFKTEVHVLTAANAYLPEYVSGIDQPNGSIIVDLEKLDQNNQDSFLYRMIFRFPNHINQRLEYEINVWCGDHQIFLVRNETDVNPNNWPNIRFDLRESIESMSDEDRIYLRIHANVVPTGPARNFEQGAALLWCIFVGFIVFSEGLLRR